MSSTVDIQSALDRLCAELQPLAADKPLMIGIHSGGVWVAEEMHKRLGLDEPLGTLDISFYRDDFTRIGMNPEVKASDLPLDVNDRHIILVDDVLHTGRTIRAAMNEIFDYGRPASIALAILVDRGGHELPIHADATGARVSLHENEHIKLVRHDDGALDLDIQAARR